MSIVTTDDAIRIDHRVGDTAFHFFGVAFSVSNLDQSIEWYADKLNFKLISRSNLEAIDAQAAFMEGAGIHLELLQAGKGFRIAEMFADPPAHMAPIGNKALVFQVDDLAKISQHLVEQNVAFAFRELALNAEGLKGSVIKDPDGNFISILEKA